MRSHPGVRTDLFQRKPAHTLVTDFFGGVAHAEVMSPHFPASMEIAGDLGGNSLEQFTVGADNGTDAVSSIRGLDPDTFFAALAADPKSEIGQPVLRKARTWASSVLVLLLAGWVIARK